STKVSKSVSKRVQIDNNDDETSNTSSNSSGSSNSSTSESQEPIHILTKRERKEKFKVVESAVNDVLIDELDNEDTGFSSPIDNDQSEDLNDKTSDDE
ncbi:2551_t:CDS:1, partial [Rhizophagus irregularis]